MNKELTQEMSRDLCDSGLCDLENLDACALLCSNSVKCQKVAERLYEFGYRKCKVGVWLKERVSNRKVRYYCSICGFCLSGSLQHHCDNCGTKMLWDSDYKGW